MNKHPKHPAEGLIASGSHQPISHVLDAVPSRQHKNIILSDYCSIDSIGLYQHFASPKRPSTKRTMLKARVGEERHVNAKVVRLCRDSKLLSQESERNGLIAKKVVSNDVANIASNLDANLSCTRCEFCWKNNSNSPSS